MSDFFIPEPPLQPVNRITEGLKEHLTRWKKQEARLSEPPHGSNNGYHSSNGFGT